jgi:hypothetical protein
MTVESGLMHVQLGITLLFEEFVVVVAWYEAKRKGDKKAEGEMGKANSHVIKQIVLGLPG